MKWTVRLTVALAAVAWLTGTAIAQDAKVQKGMQLFTAQKCTQCHSIAGKGNKKGSLDDVGLKLKPAEIKEWLTDPVGKTAKADPPVTRKPVMKKKPLSGDDLDALVAYLSTMTKK